MTRTRAIADIRRRQTLKALGLGAVALPLKLKAATGATVVIIGGGFAGASAARSLRQLAPELRIILIEASTRYTACPLSNLVIAGERSLSAQQFSWSQLAAEGIQVINAVARDIDAAIRKVTLADGTELLYDKLILAPGIRLRWNALEGYDQTAAQRMPHAWQAGQQTVLLRQQLAAMPDNGVVAISVPAAPYRCPPGPYERAGLIAHYLQQHKPRAKLIILDAKDSFSKQALFIAGWRALYGDRIEWRGLSDSGSVRAVRPAQQELITDFDQLSADVSNVIPPQAAGQIAARAGLTDATGWCPINPLSFESTLATDVHVIGDAAIANAMPKSAFAANAQAKVCAHQVVRSLAGLSPISTTLINTCYSLLAPDYGISVAGVYRPGPTALEGIPNSGGTSALEAGKGTRRLEAQYARHWFTTITQETFGAS